MTINVAVKCPDGVVLGTDSLVSVMASDPAPGVGTVAPRAFATNYRKLFQIGRLPVGVLLNGQTAIRGQTVEDIIAEFALSTGATREDITFDLREVTDQLLEFINGKLGNRGRAALQLIVGGYSRGTGGFRYGEIYAITWPEGKVEDPYPGDAEFGAYWGGQVEPIYRFISGFDRVTDLDMVAHWKNVYERIRDYVLEEVERSGVAVPESARSLPAPPLSRANPWYMLSEYDIASADSNKVELLLTKLHGGPGWSTSRHMDSSACRWRSTSLGTCC